jgi:hypothetical protein
MIPSVVDANRLDLIEAIPVGEQSIVRVADNAGGWKPNSPDEDFVVWHVSPYGVPWEEMSYTPKLGQEIVAFAGELAGRIVVKNTELAPGFGPSGEQGL